MLNYSTTGSVSISLFTCLFVSLSRAFFFYRGLCRIRGIPPAVRFSFARISVSFTNDNIFANWQSDGLSISAATILKHAIILQSQLTGKPFTLFIVDEDLRHLIYGI